jgi:hypothetical protein
VILNRDGTMPSLAAEENHNPVFTQKLEHGPERRGKLRVINRAT